MKTKLSIALISLLLVTSTVEAGKWKALKVVGTWLTKKASEKSMVTWIVGASILPVLVQAGLSPKKEFPVEPDIIDAEKNGAKDYQTHVCRNNRGELVPLPKDIRRCPYGDDPKLYNGPIIDIDREN
jgi:hypothetical protein